MWFIDGSQKTLRTPFWVLLLLLAGCAGSPPDNLGMANGKLAPCPSSPNCVSSYTQSEDHKVNPWAFKGTSKQAQTKLLTLLNQQDNVTVITNSPGYIHAEFKSNLMGFVDDVEFVIEKNQVNMRSASRVGYSDLGANRERIDQLQQAFLPCCN